MPISALITGSGGGFLFEQTAFSPYHIEDLEWDRALPGGDLSATIWTSFNGPFQLPSLGSLVVLSDLVGPWWLGIVDDPEVEYWSGGAKVAIRCVGWAATGDDLVYTARQVFTAGQTAGDMFRHARDHLCPGISQSNSFISGTAEVGLETDTENLRGSTALEIFNAAAAMGSTTADELVWKVRAPAPGDPNPTTPILEVYAAGEAPSYTIDLEQGYMIRTHVPRQQLHNHILVNYGSGTGDPLHEVAALNQIAEASSLQGIAEYNNRERHMWVDSAEKLEQAGAWLAQRVADVNLAKHGLVRTAGFTVSVPFDGTGGHPIVVGAGPDTIPIWRVDVGYQLNVDNDQSWAGLPNNPNRMITHVHGSLKQGQVQITTGILGDSRQAQRLTGAVTLRQLLDLPALTRPNRPSPTASTIVTVEHNFDAQEDYVSLGQNWAGILRSIEVYAQPLLSATGAFEHVEIIVGIAARGQTSYDTVAQQTITQQYVVLANGLSRHIDAGDRWIFFATNPVPTQTRVLIQLAVQPIRVAE